MTPLDDLNISLSEGGFESNLDVDINDDDDLFEQGILMEDSETDDLISELEASIDFDQILSTLPENLTVDFPPNFVASMFCFVASMLLPCCFHVELGCLCGSTYSVITRITCKIGTDEWK